MWVTAAGIASLVICSDDARPVVAPIVVIVLTIGIFVVLLPGDRRTAPLAEVGMWHALAVAVYSVLPMLTFVALGLRYTPLNDARLYGLQPDARLVARVGWMQATYLVAFTTSYLVVAGRTAVPNRAEVHVRSSLAWGATILLIASLLAGIGIRLYYGADAASYTDSYRAIAALPLGVRQLLRLLTGPQLIYWLVLLTWAFEKYAKRRAIIFALIAAVLVTTVVGRGSRANLALLVVASVLLYHRMVSPISYLRGALLGTTALLLFTTLGLVRQLSSPTAFDAGRLATSGEFEALFANDIDLLTRKAWHQLPRPSARQFASEILAPVPSQMLPFDKLDQSNWYVQTFYPTVGAAGGGFAFGVIAQALVGFGVPELVFRGLIAGLLLASIRRVHARRGRGLWPLVAYTWFSIMAYHSFRSGTLYPLGLFVHDFIAGYLLLVVLAMVLHRAGRPHRPSAGPAVPYHAPTT